MRREDACLTSGDNSGNGKSPMPSANTKVTVSNDSLIREIVAVRNLSMEKLRERYLELFGEETKSRNKQFLFKRIAYRLQELKHGGLSERARRRAEELDEDAPIRKKGLANGLPTLPPAGRDERLPLPGTELRRVYDGVEHTVTVLVEGFSFRGKPYRNLSVIAREITGTRWNGFAFCGLLQKENV